MSESRTKNSINNSITGLAFRLIGLFCPFLIRTIMIRKLGSEYIGLSQLFTSILQMLSLTELGIGNAMVYSMYKPMAENDTDKICALLSLYRKFYTIIGLVITGLGLLLMPFLPFLINGEHPADINIYILYVIYLFNTAISYFMFAYKKSILDAQQKVSIENAIQALCSLIMYIVQIVVLLLGANYYVYIIFFPVSTVAINIIRNHIVQKKYPDYVCGGTVERESMKEIYSKVKALIGYQIGSKVLWFADSIVISSFLGLNALAMYSNYYYIMNAIIGIVSIVYTSIVAGIGNSIIIETEEKNYKDFMTFNFGNAWIITVCSVCLLCLYQPFMKVWMGENMMFSFGMVILFVMYFYFWLFNKIGSTYTNAAGLWKEQFWKPYVSAGINLMLNIILVKTIGIAGVLLSTIVASVFIDTSWETWAIFKYIFKRNCSKFILRLLEYIAAGCVICVISYLLCAKINLGVIPSLFVYGIICLLVSNVLWIILFYRTEECKSLLKKLKTALLK